jgi:hypothetical protein
MTLFHLASPIDNRMPWSWPTAPCTTTSTSCEVRAAGSGALPAEMSIGSPPEVSRAACQEVHSLRSRSRWGPTTWLRQVFWARFQTAAVGDVYI